MQTATLIYNDRVATWRQMKQIDRRLDRNPVEEDIMQMVELRIRNLQAFDELQAMNDTGRWRYRHPLTAQRDELKRLERLAGEAPEEFMRLYGNCTDNIRRYKAFMRRPDRADRRESDRANLERHRKRAAMFKLIMLEMAANDE